MQVSHFYDSEDGRLFIGIDPWLYVCETATRRFFPVHPVDFSGIRGRLISCSEGEFNERVCDRALENLEWLATAQKICQKAHRGQTDRAGLPYATHPFAVAALCDLDEEKVVAYLHDVVEDTEVTLEDLCEAGLPDWAVYAVSLLTKEPDDPEYTYEGYLSAIRENPIARAVKIADMTHNSDPTRPKEIGRFEREHYLKYRQSLRYLRGEDETYCPPDLS